LAREVGLLNPQPGGIKFLGDRYLYIIDKQARLYVGITNDLKNRPRQHGNPPLLYKEGPLEKQEAARREMQI
jgi:predicted GIY-YIG superfamily endonuclease